MSNSSVVFRQQDGRRCSAPGLAVQFDRAMCFVDQAVYDRQAEARTLAHRLGRKKRLERPVKGGLIHAMAVIRHAQTGEALVLVSLVEAIENHFHIADPVGRGGCVGNQIEQN